MAVVTTGILAVGEHACDRVEVGGFEGETLEAADEAASCVVAAP